MDHREYIKVDEWINEKFPEEMRPQDMRPQGRFTLRFEISIPATVLIALAIVLIRLL